MLTWSLSSKKCLVASLLLGSSATLATPAFALPAPSTVQLRAELRKTLGSKGGSFAPLLAQWETRYGTTAVPGLIQIARDSATPDSDRFVALMGTTRLGGSETAPLLLPFLKDRSWMLRSGALRALGALQGSPDSRAADAVLPLLSDPALVVRSEAIDAVVALKPRGAGGALLRMLENRGNYLSSGKPLWVPAKALAALRDLRAKDALPGLKTWTRTKARAELMEAAQETIRALEK